MSSHTGRTFLNSCLKVPIDPCNNCPAPIYNRPKMYLGRLSLATPMDSNITKLNTTAKDSTIDFDSMWTSNGIRSLAKLYDSIPDYCDIHHLPEEEFYSTLDTLKTTCRELKTKSLNSCTLEQSSNTSSTLYSNCGIASKTKSKKSMKSKKSKNHSKKKSSQDKELQCNVEIHSHPETSCTVDYKRNFIDNLQWKSCKKEFENEVKEFKRTLKELEQELIRPESSIYKTKSIQTLELNPMRDDDDDKNKENDLPTRPATTRAHLRAQLRKAFSYNDINSHDAIDGDIDKNYKNAKNKNRLFQKLTKAEVLAYKDHNKLSNYFDAKTNQIEKKDVETHVPKIIVDSPSSETLSSKLSSSNCSSDKSGRKKKAKSKKIELPFTMFNLNSPTKLESCDKSTPSPVHPVARPNLAATLRAEVSRKKLQELQNNCTYHDTTPQVDWEVRKTPAWKSLSLNESHKEILSLRLATRKAEQALQHREYELHMEMMRQRVKSAPLLLEGMTFWGPNVGKLTHTCQKESVKHSCQRQKQRKQCRKNCTDRKADSDSGGGGINMNRLDNFSMSSIKLNALRKIYANSPKSYSRNSNRSARSEKTKKQIRSEGKSTELEPKTEQQLDSGDDLSSIDRAYL